MYRAILFPLPDGTGPPEPRLKQGGRNRTGPGGDGRFHILLMTAAQGQGASRPGSGAEGAPVRMQPVPSGRLPEPALLASGGEVALSRAGRGAGAEPNPDETGQPEGASELETPLMLAAGGAWALVTLLSTESRAGGAPADGHPGGRSPALRGALPLEGKPAAEQALEAFTRKAAQVLQYRMSQQGVTTEHPGAGETPIDRPGAEPRATFGDVIRLLARHPSNHEEGRANGLGGQIRELAGQQPDQAGRAAGTDGRTQPVRPRRGSGLPVLRVMPVETAGASSKPSAGIAQGAGGPVVPSEAGTQATGVGQDGSALRPEQADKALLEADRPVQAGEAPHAQGVETVVRHHPATVEAGASQEPQRPVRPEHLLTQVARYVRVMVEGDRSEAQFSLHPRHLGTIAVKLVVEEGAIQAQLLARDHAVKAVLDAHLDQLKVRLADQGLQVEQVHVTVGGDNGFGQPHSHHGEHRQMGHGWHGPGGQGHPSGTGTGSAPQGEDQTESRSGWRHAGRGRWLDSLA